MGEIRPEMLLGVKCRDKMLLARDQDEPAGKVLQSLTKPVNRANWQYPNFISKAYGEDVSVNFIKAMGVHVDFGYDANDEKDFKKLTTAIKKHVTQRDDRRAAMEEFQALMRAEAQAACESSSYPSISSSDEPSNDNCN